MLLRAVLAAGATLIAGCGYHLAGAASHTRGPFVVVAAPSSAPYSGALVAAVAGARSELARSGELAGACESCTTVVVTVVRVEEVAAATALAAPGSSRAAFAGGAVPLARGLTLRVVGRAHLEPTATDRQARAGEVRDTGEVTAAEVVARSDDPRAAASTVDAAVRRAARRLGERLARRILGIADPSPTMELGSRALAPGTAVLGPLSPATADVGSRGAALSAVGWPARQRPSTGTHPGAELVRFASAQAIARDAERARREERRNAQDRADFLLARPCLR